MAGDRRQVADAVLVNGSTMPGPTTDKPMRSPDENGFSIGLSAGPPLGAKAPSGSDAWAEVASVGVSRLRYYPTWPRDPQKLTTAITDAQGNLQAAAGHGLALWVGLNPVGDSMDDQATLTQIVEALKDEAGLGAWKGADEPNHARNIKVGDLVNVYKLVKSLDPDHPLVLIQAPVGLGGGEDVPLTAAALEPFRDAFDITGVDIFPVSYPAGKHVYTGKNVAPKNTDISLVGDITSILAKAAAGKPVWTALQISWSGVIPPKHVPRFPSLHDERFMAYQAIVAGARGLNFFGGDIVEVMKPDDKNLGWNWTFWYQVVRPLIVEVTSTAVSPALNAPAARSEVKANADDIELTARQTDDFFYVIAVRRSPQVTSEVTFSGLPSSVSSTEVLFEYDNQEFRSLTVVNGSFKDWFAPFDAHVYRFPLASPTG